eukprot:CAMPEP_0176463166 /NCGR_PEP_ID=MMETSP0127-20121128/35711_1 /TAXON_ID=938130 /ORGANISM="Platyophrya macrostoma, Strain WH" /LENGTH=198 /DNA_ID=CAMNT_0017855243 /DNA_START=251 /DNA_END=847 /DNA_ORIENTATION=+
MAKVLIRLPKSFFFDIPEVLQMHTWEHSASNHDESHRGSIESMHSEHVFDIEAPIFRIPYEFNKVDVVLRLPYYSNADSGSRSSSTMHDVSVLLPIHTRYETLDDERPFAWGDFMRPIDSFVEHCIAPEDIRAELSLDSVEAVSASHDIKAAFMMKTAAGHTPCVKFPRGILSHLPYIYWLTMLLLAAGALLVIAVIR